MVYNDPRRFGSFDYFAHANLEDYKHFSDLGPEPFSEDFSLEYFYQKSRNKSSPIKNFIMDQRIVVGVGNIYAAEALFLSAIKPTREAGKVKRQELEILRKNIIDILHLAIEKGGSSIKDFKQADGSESYFQMDFKVYDRAGQACFECGSILKNIVLGGRASVYCHRCQK